MEHTPFQLQVQDFLLELHKLEFHTFATVYSIHLIALFSNCRKCQIDHCRSLAVGKESLRLLCERLETKMESFETLSNRRILAQGPLVQCPSQRSTDYSLHLFTTTRPTRLDVLSTALPPIRNFPYSRLKSLIPSPSFLPFPSHTIISYFPFNPSGTAVPNFVA